ncbi:MAG: hypothetical protein KUL86_07000 [Castellaniella sp.]|nr:hypothetical protein [Castellaniella sp.]
MAILMGEEERPQMFTITGMAAALGMSEEAFYEALTAGEVTPPSNTRHGLALWTREALFAEVERRIPERDRGLDEQSQVLLYLMPAIERAQIAEIGGGHHAGNP